MKHILDSSFHYRPSFDTDVRKTFEKVRRQQGKRHDPASPEADARPMSSRVRVLQLDQLKKASGA